MQVSDTLNNLLQNNSTNTDWVNNLIFVLIGIILTEIFYYFKGKIKQLFKRATWLQITSKLFCYRSFKALRKAFKEGLKNKKIASLFLDFPTYKNIAISISNNSTNYLIWSLFGSPLKTDRNRYIHSDYLTDEDKKFKDIMCINKLRLVIFSDETEISEFINCPEGELRNRKLKFLASCESNDEKFKDKWHLQFTSVPILEEKFGKSENWDFGYTSNSSNRGILFQSGFYTKTHNSAGDGDWRHAHFYDLGKSENLPPAVHLSISQYKPTYLDFRILMDAIISFTSDPTQWAKLVRDKDNINDLIELTKNAIVN